MENVKFALFLLVALVPSMILHEYAHAVTADRLGDPTPRRWGRLGFNPKPMIDPFGTIILPGLILLLVASGHGLALLPIFAYAKPMPVDPSYLKNRARDTTLIALAGPLTNLAIAAVAGILLRLDSSGDLRLFAYAVLVVNLFLFVFNLMPVPGLDGAKILARFLPPRPREVYTGLDQYLVLFILVIFFLLAGPLLAVVRALAGGVCAVLAGSANC
ncbi:MAG: site-2 protease family protein [Actinomycetota bacterium]